MQKNSDHYILIIWDSMTGGSKSMAQAAYNGALSQAALSNDEISSDTISVIIKHASDVSRDDMLLASAYIFAFPENLAAISGIMKAFFDRLYYDCVDAIEGRPYAIMICAGSDGENAMRQAVRICTGWRLKQIGDHLIVKTHAQTKAEILAPKVIADKDRQKCHAMGAAMSAGLSMGIY